jgi:hypothetical protein
MTDESNSRALAAWRDERYQPRWVQQIRSRRSLLPADPAVAAHTRLGGGEGAAPSLAQHDAAMLFVRTPPAELRNHGFLALSASRPPLVQPRDPDAIQRDLPSQRGDVSSRSLSFTPR